MNVLAQENKCHKNIYLDVLHFLQQKRESMIKFERDFHHFNDDALSKSDYILFDFADKVDQECNENALNDTENPEVEDNILPVGATYEENFMREVANLQGLKVVPDDLTCTQVAQKWSVPAQGAKQTSNAVYFEELTFEKADFKRDQSCSRKKALVKGIRKDFCATPEFAKEVKSDEIKDLAAALKGSGKCHLLVAALEGNDFKPCNTFQTSCRPLKIAKTNKMYQEDDPDNISDFSLRQIGFFNKFAGYTPLLGGRLMSA
eukprot:gene8562-9478_t